MSPPWHARDACLDKNFVPHQSEDLLTLMLKQQQLDEESLTDEEILDEVLMFYAVCAITIHHNITVGRYRRLATVD